MKKVFTIIIFLILANLLNAQVTKTVNVPTAGTLKSLLTATEKTTVTKIIVSGTIDASDFLLLRDAMSSLTYIDLSGTTIASYSGTKGTSSTTTSYSENSIPIDAFRENSSGSSILQTIIVPSTITQISNSAFSGCNSLTSFSIPEGVTDIGSSAFSDCIKLTSITIPSSVLTLGDWAFAGCSKISSLNIPTSIKTIGANAFNSTGGNFTVDAANQYFSVTDSVLFDKNQSILIHCSLNKSGSYTIPGTVLSIGESAFSDCTLLNNIVLPLGLTTINYGAFSGCKGLISFKFPASITSIGDMAFNNCTGLTSIYVNNTTPIKLSTNSFVFFSVNTSVCVLYVPFGTLANYEAASQWRDFFDIEENVFTGIENTQYGQSESEKYTIKLYPNPVRDNLEIEFDGGSGFELLNMMGKSIYSGNLTHNNSIRTTGLSSGIYLIRFNTGNSFIYKKIIKE